MANFIENVCTNILLYIARYVRPHIIELEQQIQIVFCGTGTPNADKTRAQSCTCVLTKAQSFVVDCGDTAATNMILFGVPLHTINVILITHLHCDHIAGLVDLCRRIYIERSNRGLDTVDLTVVGPIGIVKTIEGLKMMINEHEKSYSKFVNFSNIIAMDKSYHEFMFGDDVIKAFEVKHGIPAYCYRIESGNKSVVISGDTAPCQGIYDACMYPTDLLIHEAQNKKVVKAIVESIKEETHANALSYTMTVHSSPEEVLDVVNSTKVSKLIFTHVDSLHSWPQSILGKILLLKNLNTHNQCRPVIAYDGFKVIV